MPVIAVTGGIAAGKSVVCRTLAGLGAEIIDADVLARRAVEPGPVLDALVRQFGERILNSDGSLNRGELGSIVFGDDSARETLNSLVHPEVKRLYQDSLKDLEGRPDKPIIVYDIPLLAEARTREEFDLIVVVHAPANVRIQRLQELRGMTEDDARSRVEAQADDEDRLRLADVVIDSSTSEAETIRQTEELFAAVARSWPDRLAEVPSRFPPSGS